MEQMHPEAFRMLYELHAKHLLHYAMQMVTREQGEDIVCSAFHKLWKYHQTVKDPSAIKAWLFRTVTNECIVALGRRKCGQRAIARFTGMQQQDQLPELLEDRLELTKRASTLLKAHNRQIIQLILQGHPREYIMEKMGISPKTLRNKRSAAISELRNLLINKYYKDDKGRDSQGAR